MSDQDPSSGDEEATMEELSDERENETTRKRKALSPPVKQEKKKFPKQDRETSDESMAEDSDREKSSDENSASDEPLTHIEMEVTERLMSQMSRQSESGDITFHLKKEVPKEQYVGHVIGKRIEETLGIPVSYVYLFKEKGKDDKRIRAFFQCTSYKCNSKFEVYFKKVDFSTKQPVTFFVARPGCGHANEVYNNGVNKSHRQSAKSATESEKAENRVNRAQKAYEKKNSESSSSDSRKTKRKILQNSSSTDSPRESPERQALSPPITGENLESLRLTLPRKFMLDYRERIADYLESENKKGLTDAQIAANLRLNPDTFAAFLLRTNPQPQAKPSLQAKNSVFIDLDAEGDISNNDNMLQTLKTPESKKLENKGGLDKESDSVTPHKLNKQSTPITPQVTSKENPNCPICKKYCDTESILCDFCLCWYHRKCINWTAKQLKQASEWKARSNEAMKVGL